MREEFDLVVVGHGAAAFAATIKASELGVRVAMVGRNATPGTVIGGTCVNVGCVPSKRLLAAGEAYRYPNRNFDTVQIGDRSIDFGETVREKEALVRMLRLQKYVEVVKNLPNVTYYNEKASFLSEGELRAGRRTLRAKSFVIATGASTKVPRIDGIEDAGYLTNEEALSNKRRPESMVVIGGGPLGLEFAQMYSHLGTMIVLLQRRDRILPREEPEISEALRKYLEAEGMEILTNAEVRSVGKKGPYKVVEARVDNETRTLRSEALLVATGRQPNTSDLNLAVAGVETDGEGFVVVDDETRTSNPRIYAAGDVCGEPMLETTAAKEGAIAAENALTGSHKKIDYDSVPHAVFTYPQVASVGLTDQRAIELGYKCSCKTLYFDAVPKALIMNDTRGLIKMVVDAETKRVLGVHILAPYAADLIHAPVFAVKKRLTIDDLIDTVFNFPTLSESIKLVAQTFYKDVTKLSCCVE